VNKLVKLKVINNLIYLHLWNKFYFIRVLNENKYLPEYTINIDFSYFKTLIVINYEFI